MSAMARWTEAKAREVAAQVGRGFTDREGKEWTLVAHSDGGAHFETADGHGWSMSYEMALVLIGRQKSL